MRGRTRAGLMPGMSVLGGAAAGLSYEGALRDAIATEERAARRAAGRRRPVPTPQLQERRHVEALQVLRSDRG